MTELIVVTGATGWVGRNFLHQLQLQFPHSIYKDKVLAFGSKSQIINSTAYNSIEKIKIHPLSSMNKLLKKKKNLSFIHTAFLTRDKIKYYGIKKYIKTNREITKIVKDTLMSCPDSKSVIISSGAATNHDKEKSLCNSIFQDPYGCLKIEEENSLKTVSNCLILRLYALTGRFIRDPNIFAFGNFLLSAKKGNPIIIRSANKVIRSYGYAEDIAKVSINWLLSNKILKNKFIFAASHTLDLLNLAEKISNIYNLPKPICNYNKNLPSNDYTCITDNYINLLKDYNLEATKLVDQIKNSFLYI